MASIASSLGEPARLNIWVRLSGFVLGALLPFILYFSTKSATLFVGVAAVLALIGCWKAGLWPAIRLQAPRWTAVTVSAALFSAYVIASTAWSRHPDVVLNTLTETAIALGVALALAVAYRVLLPYRFGFGIALGLIAAALYALLEFRLGMKLRGMAGIRAETFVFNRSMVYQVLLIWPMLLLIETKWRQLAAVALVCVAVAAGVSDSGAAVFGLVIGALCACFAMVASRLTWILLAIGTVAYTAIAPWLGTLMSSAASDSGMRFLQNAHAQERINIWRAFGEFYWQNPIFGIGFGTSVKAPFHPAAASVEQPLRDQLGANHPHNAFLQVWVELGAVGAILFAALCVALLAGIHKLDRRARIIASGFAGSVLAITAVSHGAWQAWWLTTISVFAGIFWATRDGD